MSAGTVIKKLPVAWMVAGQKADDVEVRPPLLDDLIEAEKEAHPGVNPNAFHRALACQTIVRAGTFTGPFAPAHFKGMKTQTWYVIRDALLEAEALGEDEQPSKAPTS